MQSKDEDQTTMDQQPGQEAEADQADSANRAAEAERAVESISAPGITTESVVEAILVATDVPLTAGKIAAVLGSGDARDVKAHIETLNERYRRESASFLIQHIAKGYQILTLPEFNHWVGKLQKSRAESRLSPAALETLAVVAYKQPVMRAGIEAVRGVAVGEMLARLRELNLIKIVGRAEEIGRPLLYGTTNRFLEVFGLGTLGDLPAVEEEADRSVPLLRPVKELADEPPADD